MTLIISFDTRSNPGNKHLPIHRVTKIMGDRLYTSESDVYRRQIPTYMYKDCPRTERIKTFIMAVDT